MKTAAILISMGLAIAALVVGLIAARRWWDASKVDIDPGWTSGMPGDTRPIQPADLEGNGTRDGWISATIQAATQGADLNEKAASAFQLCRCPQSLTVSG